MLYIIKKIKPKWIRELKVKTKTTQVLEYNMDEFL